jgi:hypothetical protein
VLGRFGAAVAASLATAALAVGAFLATPAQTHVVTRTTVVQTPEQEMVCIRNLAQKYISDATIKRDIPAWTKAVNEDFAKYWHTAHYQLIFAGRAQCPEGVITAVFQDKGPIDGALAYHWTERNGAPSITVYAGTGVYYGYNNSVSFTHELFELAADPLTSYASEGYPALAYWIEKPDMSIEVNPQDGIIAWFNEVADPVEADYYTINGVEISDFVTPAWFNDGVGSRFDFMGLCQQPFWIRPGGYAQYQDALGWHQVLNFRKAHPSDAGFSKLDPQGRD